MVDERDTVERVVSQSTWYEYCKTQAGASTRNVSSYSLPLEFYNTFGQHGRVDPGPEKRVLTFSKCGII